MTHITYLGRHLCSGRRVKLSPCVCEACAKKMSVLIGLLKAGARQEALEKSGTDYRDTLAWIEGKGPCKEPF